LKKSALQRKRLLCAGGEEPACSLESVEAAEQKPGVVRPGEVLDSGGGGFFGL
jgi:hypothetical protein